MTADDTLALHLTGTGQGGPKAVDIELSDDVRWDLRFSGGSTDVDADLAGASFASVEFTAGITRIDLALPEPAAQVPVRVSGGASQFTLHAAQGVPVRVRVGGGAGTVSVDGAQRNGVPGGTDLTPPGWADAERRIDVDLTSGVSTVVVDRDVSVPDVSVGGRCDGAAVEVLEARPDQGAQHVGVHIGESPHVQAGLAGVCRPNRSSR